MVMVIPSQLTEKDSLGDKKAPIIDDKPKKSINYIEWALLLI